jgi:hypothetical protein
MGLSLYADVLLLVLVLGVLNGDEDCGIAKLVFA